MKTYKQLQQELSIKARQILLDGLAQCTPDQRLWFKVIYSQGKEPELHISDVVKKMPEKQLEHAMIQVSRTLDVNKE